MIKVEISIIGKILALISFIGGTGLLILYYFYPEIKILFVSYLYTILCFFINLVVLVIIFYKVFKHKEKNTKIKYIKTILLMFINIPIVLVYFYFINTLLNTMRVLIINPQKDVVSNIKITGCEYHQVETLNPQENKEIWVKIKGDCSIKIEYILNNKKNEAFISGYCTSNMGSKITYKIGEKQ